MKFSELNISDSFVENLKENNFTECTDVQKLTIPQILEGKSLMVQAQTGTGKTAAFLIPLLDKIQNPADGAPAHKKFRPMGLVVAPTRELASQIMEDAEILGAEAFNIKGATLTGGSNIDRQRQDLAKAQFIVSTPGRLLDFCSHDSELLSQVTYFVLDESDRLFDMGFYPDLKKIIQYLPKPEIRTSLLFSATLPVKVRDLARQSFHNPTEVDVAAKSLAVDKITQEVVYVLNKDKISLTLGYLKQLEATQTALVFTNTKHNAESLALKLRYNGINCDYINGDLPQNKRQRVIERIKSKKLSVLIATDVAARGIHIHDLDLVINYDIPDDPQSYIHRIGRTGRAGQEGEAITFVCDKYAYNLEAIHKLLGHKIPQIEENYKDLMAEDISAGMKVKELARIAKSVLHSEHFAGEGSGGGRSSGRDGGGRSGGRDGGGRSGGRDGGGRDRRPGGRSSGERTDGRTSSRDGDSGRDSGRSSGGRSTGDRTGGRSNGARRPRSDGYRDNGEYKKPRDDDYSNSEYKQPSNESANYDAAHKDHNSVSRVYNEREGSWETRDNSKQNERGGERNFRSKSNATRSNSTRYNSTSSRNGDRTGGRSAGGRNNGRDGDRDRNDRNSSGDEKRSRSKNRDADGNIGYGERSSSPRSRDDNSDYRTGYRSKTGSAKTGSSYKDRRPSTSDNRKSDDQTNSHRKGGSAPGAPGKKQDSKNQHTNNASGHPFSKFIKKYLGKDKTE